MYLSMNLFLSIYLHLSIHIGNSFSAFHFAPVLISALSTWAMFADVDKGEVAPVADRKSDVQSLPDVFDLEADDAGGSGAESSSSSPSS